MINLIKTNLKRIIIFFLLIIFQNSAFSEKTIENTQTDLQELQKKIDKLDSEIKKNSDTKKGLTTELKKEEKKISKSKKALYQIKKKEKNMLNIFTKNFKEKVS